MNDSLDSDAFDDGLFGGNVYAVLRFNPQIWIAQGEQLIPNRKFRSDDGRRTKQPSFDTDIRPGSGING